MFRTLLAAGEPHPVMSLRRDGRSPFVFCVDHASPRIPMRLGTLGLPAWELERHIAVDIGALGVALAAAERLGAVLVAQNYSRLVIDCNRDPRTDSSIPLVSELTPIPGNCGLSADEIAARRTEIFEPYHAHLRALLDERHAAGRQTIVVSQHSMTDNFKGSQREMHAAVLYCRDARIGKAVLTELRRERGLIVAENEPYRCNEATDYTIFNHAEGRGLPYLELEIRQDLIRDADGQAAWGRRVAEALESVAHKLEAVLSA